MIVDIAEKPIEFNADVRRVVDHNKMVIRIPYGGRTLSFKNIEPYLMLCRPDTKPVVWKDIQVPACKGEDYVITCTSEGVPYQRRNSYRLSLCVECSVDLPTHRDVRLTIKDISTTGFSFFIPKTKDISVVGRAAVTAYLVDSGMSIKLNGIVVRQCDCELGTTYGCKMFVEPSGLQKYIAAKQRKSMKRT